MVTLVDGVLANGVVMIFEMDIAFYAIQGTEILSLMIQLRILSIILPIFHTHLHNPNTCHTLELAEYINTPSWNRPTIYCDDDDDEDYTIAITPDLPITDSLIMEDEHLDTILTTESDELIKSSVENLSNPGFFDSNDDSTSIDDDSFSIDDVDYVEASPPDSELVSLEVVEIGIPKGGGIDTDILLIIKERSTYEKFVDVQSSIAKNEALKIIPLHLPIYDQSTSYSDLSLPDYEAFFYDSEPDSGNFTMDVVEDIFDHPTRNKSSCANVLPLHPTLHLDSDFTLSRIFIGIQSMRFLSLDEFSISFICNPLSLVFDTLLPFSFENKDNIFNPGILASNEEKSPHLLSHRGFKAFQLILKAR
ncbi:hypothetical protein Tco_1549325 [Tanacetum coccineum]